MSVVGRWQVAAPIGGKFYDSSLVFPNRPKSADLEQFVYHCGK